MARLAIRTPGVAEEIREINEAVLTIGRAQECSLCLCDGAASRRHCQLTRNENGYLISDLGGRNPVRINGEVLGAPVLLRPGDLITLGHTEMLYVCTPDEFAAASADIAATAAADEDADAVPQDSVPAMTDGDGTKGCVGGSDVNNPSENRRIIFSPLSETEVCTLVPADASSARKPDKAQAKPRLRFKPDLNRIRAVAAYRELRKRNDMLAKLTIFLLFGVPVLALDAYIIWYLFYSE